jgi:uncharacterized tannase-like protein DUF6351
MGRITVTVGLLAALLGANACSGSSNRSSTSSLRVSVVSGRADMVTGGDTRLRVDDVTSPTALRFWLSGNDVTSSVRSAQEGHAVVALVGGITPGRHALRVTAGRRQATLTIRSFPITGPVFSGPHLPLPVCTTEQNGLAAPTDADCSAPTKVTWQYRSTSGRFVALTVPGPRPPDVETVDVGGRRVDEIVRVEEGVINRAVYWVSVLDPGALTRAGDVTGPGFDTSGWNQRLVYRFGGGCGTSYSQGAQLGTEVVDHALLSHGYAIATSTFNTFQVQCNDVLSAETMMMVKERVAKAYGPPRFTIGDGASGGAIQQLLIAQNYPGLLDAIAPTLPFPDAISTAGGVSDCGLLSHFFTTLDGRTWTDAQRAAVEGPGTTGTCRYWVGSFLGTINPTSGCDPRIPKAQIYDAVTNPRGLRCTLQDENRNQLGIDPATGFARRPLDNVGVQYGLVALRDHVIGPEQFVALNEQIGGYDLDGRVVSQREDARPEDVQRAFEDGRVLEGGGASRSVPIITTNVYNDSHGDIHDRFRVFEIRERLRDGSSVDQNHVIWTVPPGSTVGASPTGAVANSLVLVALLDDWLTTGRRPANAVDTCVLPDGRPVTGAGVNETSNECRQAYPSFGNSRTAAGGPIRDDVLKCALKPLDFGDYGVAFDPAEQNRLRAVFPGGACDYRRPSVGFGPSRPWVNYGSTP